MRHVRWNTTQKETIDLELGMQYPDSPTKYWVIVTASTAPAWKKGMSFVLDLAKIDYKELK